MNRLLTPQTFTPIVDNPSRASNLHEWYSATIFTGIKWGGAIPPFPFAWRGVIFILCGKQGNMPNSTALVANYHSLSVGTMVCYCATLRHRAIPTSWHVLGFVIYVTSLGSLC
jgi:hypothetical protein